MWTTVDPLPLTRSSFLSVLEGTTPLILERGFLSKETSQALTDHIGPRASPYLHVAGPQMKRLGVAQFEFQAQSADDFKTRGSHHKDKYFEEVARHASVHTDLEALFGDNPLSRLLAQIAALVPEWDVGIATETSEDTPGGSRKYYAGIYRAINESTPIHCDWSPFDSATEDWILNRITHQAVFNLYCADIHSGGETILYDLQWSEEAMQFRDPKTYGYFPEMIEGRKKYVLRPGPGDLALFNTRGMHEVKPVGMVEHPVLGQWSPPRVTLSSFMGLLPSEVTGGRPRLIFWS